MPGSETVTVTIALKAANVPYQFNGPASCTHAPKASIYGTLSRQWSVQQHDGGRSATLTFWRPTGGGADMFTLAVTAPGRSSVVSTTKGPDGGTPQGTGTVAFAASGNGGTFTIDAKTTKGEPITGTITCSAFTAAYAEGGD